MTNVGAVVFSWIKAFFQTQVVHHVTPVDVGVQFNTFLQQVYGVDSGRDFGMSSDFTKASSTYRNDYISGKVDGRNLVNLSRNGYGGVSGSGSPVVHAGGHPSYNGAYGKIVSGIASNLRVA
jgi:hypothetical protein